MTMKLLVLFSLMSLVYSNRPQFSDDRGQFKENGFSFKHNNGRGREKMEFGLAFIVEETEFGHPVCGDHALIKLGDNVNRSRVSVDTDDTVSRGRLDADSIDPSGMIMRGGRPPPRGGRGPPERQGRDPDQSIDVSEDLRAESTSSRFSYNGEGHGPRFLGELTAALITSSDEQNITVGSERQVVRSGNIKYTLEISDFSFCGGERVCQCDNGTNSTTTQLRVCFKTKGSRSGPPQYGNSSDDGLPEFDVGEARIKFSRRFLRQNDSSSEIVEIPDEHIESSVRSFDGGENIPVVCVTFERGSDNETIIYDPTSEVDDDDSEDTTTGSDGNVALPYAILLLAMAMLNYMM